MRLDVRVGVRLVVGLAVLCGLMLSASAVTVTHAAAANERTMLEAANSATCSGGAITPGTYASLTISGACSIPSGTVTVLGNLTIRPHATLDASTANQTLIVGGNLLVERGASLILGCSQGSGCATNTTDRVSGNVIATQPLFMILHGDTIRGNFLQQGGGGGATCPSNPANQVFATIEDSHIGGNILVSGYHSCWYGLIRVHVSGNVVLTNNVLADPDAMEIVTNTIAGNLICSGNSPAPQVGDSSGSPNIVMGIKTGQCVHIH